MVKILQASLQQYMNRELSDVQAGFRKGRRTRDQIANICWIIKKLRVPEKHLLLLYWLSQSLWLCGSQQTGKFWKRWEYQTTLPASWEICTQVKKKQLELDIKQQTGSKSGKKYVKAVYYHSTYFSYMQNTSCKMLGWRKHKLESRLPKEASITSGTQIIPPLWQKLRRNWRVSCESKRREWKVWLKTQLSEN